MTAQYCDGCGPHVRAKVIVTLTSGGLLTYCNSHYTQYRIALERADALTYKIADD